MAQDNFSILLGAMIDKAKGLKQIENDLSTIQKKVQEEYKIKMGVELDNKTAKKVASQYTQAQQDMLKSSKSQFYDKISVYIKENTKLTKGFSKELTNIQNKIKDVDSTGLKQLKKDFQAVTTQAKAFGSTGVGVVDKFKSDIGNFLTFITAGGAVMAVISSFRDVVEEVKNIDSAMVGLKKVTNETNASYENFLTNAAQKAKNLGASISDVINMTAEWAKAGYNLEDSSRLAEVSTIFTNVGDVDASTAVKDIVTALKAYNIEAKNAISVVDKLNEVDNNFAVSSADVGIGLANAASALALAGNDINESIALITGGSEITQNASEQGNAIKVLSMRLRGMKGELEAIGEEFENIDSISKIQTQIYNLSKGKVNIMDDLDPTKFKSTYEIMKQISKVWNDISQTDQAALLEIIAGKQRGNQVAAIISAFQSGQIDKALQTAINSQNSALDEQQKYMDGIQYSLDRMKASMQELSTVTLDSSTVKFFVDLANGAINATTNVGGLVPVLSTLLVTYLAFNKADKFTFVQDFAKRLLTVSTNAKTATMSVEGLAASSKALSFAMGTGVMLAVTAITMAVTKYAQSVEEAKERSRELTQQYEDERKTISEQIASYKELEEKLINGNLSVEQTKSVKEQLLIIQDSLIEKFGLEADAIDLVNGKYDDQIDKLVALSRQKANEYVALNEGGFEAAKRNTQTTGTYSLTGDYNNKMSKELNDFLSTYEGINVESVNRGLLGIFGKIEIPDVTKEELYNLLTKLYTDIGNELGDSQEVQDFQSKITKMLTGIDKNQLDIDNDTIKSYTEALVLSNETLAPLYNDATKAINDYNNALASGNGISDATYNLNKIKTAVYYNTNAVEGSKEVFDDLFATISTGATTTANTTKTQVENLLADNADAIDNYQKSIKTITDSINKMGDLSTSDVLDLMQEFSNFDWGAFGVTGVAGVGNLEGALKSLATQQQNSLDDSLRTNEALKQMYNDAMQASSSVVKLTDNISKKEQTDENFYKAVLKNLSDSVKDQAEQYGINFNDYKSLLESKLALDKEYATRLQSLNNAEMNFRNVMYGSDPAQKQKLSEEWSAAQDAFNEYTKLVGNFNTSLDKTGQTYKSGGNNGSKEKPAWLVQYEKDKSDLDHDLAMGEYEDNESAYYDKLEKLNNSVYKKHKKDFLDTYRQNQEEVYKGRKQISDDLAKEAEKAEEERLKKQQKQIDNVIESFSSSLSLSNDKASQSESGSTEQFSAYAEGLRTAGNEVDYLEGQIKKLKKAFKDGKIDEENYTEQLEDLTSSLGDAKDAMAEYQWSMVENIRDSRDQQLDDLKDAFDDEKDAIEDRYETEINYIKEITDARIKDLQAQKKSNDYNKDVSKLTDELSDYDKRIADLKKAVNSDGGDRKAKAELDKLTAERAKVQEELDEKQADHKLEIEVDALEKYADDYEKQANKNKEIDISAAKSAYEAKLSNIKSLYAEEERLILHAADYTKSQFTEVLNSINSQITSFSGNSNTGIPNNNTAIGNSYDALVGASQNSATSVRDAQILAILTNGNGKGSGGSELNKYVTDKYGKQLSYVQMAQLASLFGITGVDSTSIQKDTATKDLILKKLKAAKFHSGGYVDASWLSNKEGIGLVKHGEPILTVEQGKMFKEFTSSLPNLNKLIKLTVPDVSNISNITNSKASIHIDKFVDFSGANITGDQAAAKINTAANNAYRELMEKVRQL